MPSERTLYILPLEPLEERYTEQWYRWLREGLEHSLCDLSEIGKTFNFQFIDGCTLTKEVQTGLVLDAEGTNYWKFTQLQKVCELFKNKQVCDGDAFFTMDLWHPGLEAIRYMATLEGIYVYLFGFLHAGSYTYEDFAAPMAPWAKYHEVGWAVACDAIFMGSEYHKWRFIVDRTNALNVPTPHIYTYGCFCNAQEVLSMAGEIKPVKERENIIIFPHRFDKGKRPDEFLDIMSALWKQRQDFQVWFTTGRKKIRSDVPGLVNRIYKSEFDFKVFENVNKMQFYLLLKNSKIAASTTIEENFGIAIYEAMLLGTCPVVVNCCSYPDLLSDLGDEEYNFMFDRGDVQGAVDLMSFYLDHPRSIPYSALKRWNDAIDKTIHKMLEIMEVI